MDEPNATRVSAQPDEVQRPPREQALHISLRLTTVVSAKHITGLLLEILSARGHKVDAIRIRRHEALLSSFDRNQFPGTKL